MKEENVSSNQDFVICLYVTASRNNWQNYFIMQVLVAGNAAAVRAK